MTLSTPQEMDNAAQQAKEIWDKIPEEETKQVAAWMKEWYLKAGYKRLGKIVIGKY